MSNEMNEIEETTTSDDSYTIRVPKKTVKVVAVVTAATATAGAFLTAMVRSANDRARLEGYELASMEQAGELETSDTIDEPTEDPAEIEVK